MMDILTLLIERVQQIQHGFAEICKAADELGSADEALPCIDLANQLFKS
jgi:hypothetical protein